MKGLSQNTILASLNLIPDSQPGHHLHQRPGAALFCLLLNKGKGRLRWVNYREMAAIEVKKLHTPRKEQDQQLNLEGRWRYVEMPGDQDTYVTHMKANQPPKAIMKRSFITQMRRLHGLSAEKQM